MKKILWSYCMFFSISMLLMGCSVEEQDIVEDDITSEVEDTTEDDNDVSEDTEDENVVAFGTFATVTTAGDEVTESIFTDYDITMVNIWATWCSPCVNEMEELQELYAGLDDNVNVISICYDGATKTELANEIFSANGVEFMALVPDSQIEANIISTLQYFPTTIFVNSEGNIVGTRMEGAPSSNVVATYEYYIEEALSTLE